MPTNSLKGVPRSWAPNTEVQTADLAPASRLVIPQDNLGYPKIVKYQQTVLFSQFTDGGGASGTLSLSTTIPAGAVVLRTLYTAITGFTGDTSAVAKLGDGTTADRYMTGTPSVFTTAAQGVDAGAVSGTAWHTAAKTPVLTVTSAADFTAVAAGAMTVTIFWFQAA
jgi:hypothetical protein